MDDTVLNAATPIFNPDNVATISDSTLPLENQLCGTSFKGGVLPKGYQKGHSICRAFFFSNRERLMAIGKFSVCFVQHHQLNKGLRSDLESFAKISTAKGNVRFVTITVTNILY